MPFRSSGRGAYGPQGQKVLKGPLAPVWTTFSPGAVGTAAFSYTFVATDDSGDAPTYSVASGALPTSLTLNATTGVLSGTATVSGTYTYTLRATDVNGRSTDTTSISQTVSLALFTFTNATFNPGAATGRTGPTLQQARDGMTGSTIDFRNNTSFFNVSIGVQFWNSPAAGTYRITAAGAKGGGGNGNGGVGAVMRGDFTLSTNEQLRIVVGQRGLNGNVNGGNVNGGGSGASAVSRVSNGELLIVAGGGAGITNNTNSAISTRNARTDQDSSNGYGFGRSTYYYSQGSAGPNWDGGGGGSWGSNGDQYGGQRDAYGRNLQSSDPQGGSGRNYPSGGDGGFGGGGGSGIEDGAPGGGGGYRGGNAAYSAYSSYADANNGTGGSSYNIGTTQSNSISNTGNGYVTILKL